MLPPLSSVPGRIALLVAISTAQPIHPTVHADSEQKCRNQCFTVPMYNGEGGKVVFILLLGKRAIVRCFELGVRGVDHQR